MSSARKIKYLMTAFLALSLFISACSPKGDGNRGSSGGTKKDDGGQHGGGGLGFQSTPDEVRNAIKKAIDLVSSPDPRMNVLVRFQVEQGFFRVMNGEPIFPNFREDPKTADFITERFAASRTIKVLRNKQIRYLEKGNCPNADGKHADASVSNYTPDAELCFSVGNLTRYPKGVILNEVLSLLVHEMVHMEGVVPEDEPEKWQKSISSYFSVRFGAQKDELMLMRMDRLWLKGYTALTHANSILEKSPTDPRAFAKIGEFIEAMRSLPDFYDPLALFLTVVPKRPDLNYYYTNSVLAIIDKAQKNFGLRGGENEQLPSHDLTMRTLRELSVDIQAIRRNMWLYATGRGFGNVDVDPICVLPERQFYDHEFAFQSKMMARFHIVFPGPPRKCDINEEAQPLTVQRPFPDKHPGARNPMAPGAPFAPPEGAPRPPPPPPKQN